MPAIIDYPAVLARLTAEGLGCNYPHSGAFGFSEAAEVFVQGWIGGPDATIKAELAARARVVANPAAAATRLWRETLGGAAWIMPASHWHFELHDGSRDWLAGALADIGVDAKLLENRADGAALEFAEQEGEGFTRLLGGLLKNLRVSDFTLAFPGRPLVALVHHHGQLWWSTTDRRLLDRVAAAGG